MIRLHALALVLLFAVGCGYRQTPGRLVDMDIPVIALTEPIHLKGCKPGVYPPECKRITAAYRRGNEVVRLKPVDLKPCEGKWNGVPTDHCTPAPIGPIQPGAGFPGPQ